MGPYGPIYKPIWVLMGPYGPIWALMGPYVGPYGPLWVLLGRSWKFRQISVRLLDQFRTFRVQKLDFDEISK